MRFFYSLALNLYHRLWAFISALWYGCPSNKMIVIGVTGTNGKSTTTYLIAKILEHCGFTTGCTSTALFKVRKKEWLNDKKMTMVGRTQLQGLLRQMADAGCQYAVVETSSEGIKQYRHWGINYDLAVFTNLTPEHIESHGSFNAYKEAKGKLFKHLTKRPVKRLVNPMTGKLEDIPKRIIANVDDEHSDYYLGFPATEKVAYSCGGKQPTCQVNGYFGATDIELRPDGSSFTVNEQRYEVKLPGMFNVFNALAAISATASLGMKTEDIASGLMAITSMPGRMEFINQGQLFKVLVDYAPEPESLKQCYEALKLFPHKQLIHVLGSAGGGRDKSRRPILGKMAALQADVVIVTNEDPYDEDPAEIIEQVAAGAVEGGKVLGDSLLTIIDRKEALKRAFQLAGDDDLVLLTGKGCEQAICVANGKKIPWDERTVAREVLGELGHN
ncbi:MAG: UDP-N-acetylmuramoyl-L-alanyl-D-glutamate--2,6-diaminopimelate ligase [bacterium]